MVADTARDEEVQRAGERTELGDGDSIMLVKL